MTINITQVANFDIHDKSNLAQRWKKCKQSFEFYFSASGTNDDSQMRVLPLHSAGRDVQDIFMHWEDGGTTYKAAMDALNNHFQSKKNVVFERQVFRQAIQGTNKPSINLLQEFINLPPCGNLASADNWVTCSPKISHLTKRGVFDLYLNHFGRWGTCHDITKWAGSQTNNKPDNGSMTAEFYKNVYQELSPKQLQTKDLRKQESIKISYCMKADISSQSPFQK